MRYVSAILRGLAPAAALLLATLSTVASAQPAEGLYGPAKSQPSANIPRVQFPARENWAAAPFFYVQTALSPATLYHSTTKSLVLFSQMKETGIGGPTYVAYATPAGPRVAKHGESIDANAMSECWLLVWFSGAQGWGEWGSPWVAYLQKKPSSGRLDANGLWLEFPESAGDVVLMPLYGYYKTPQAVGSARPFPQPPLRVQTWNWPTVLGEIVLGRVRYWARVSREFPLYCEDSFSVDRAQDTVTIRQQMQWRSIDDAWNTPHLKFAPLSPVLGLAADGHFPVKFSGKLKDPEMFTPYGPYTGVENADFVEAEFHVLQYVNETEAVDPPNTAAHPAASRAWLKLRHTAAAKFKQPDAYAEDAAASGLCRPFMGDGWYAKGLPYYDPATRKLAVESLKLHFRNDVLSPSRFTQREYPPGSGRTYLTLECPGGSPVGEPGEAGKFATTLLETLWDYAHFTGDWDLVVQRWPMVKKLFCTTAETRWVGFGRDGAASLGDEAAPCLAFARLAYRVGDIDAYNYACYAFARELVHHYAKQKGAAYFQERQPWQSMEPLGQEVYLTSLMDQTAGWLIDGPNYPASASQRPFNHRWVRFNNEDVARFYRDYLPDEAKSEMDLILQRWPAKKRYVNDPHLLPSIVQLRSLLLNEGPSELSILAAPEKFGGPASGVIASCISVLRTSHPTRIERLIPAGPASPFVAGLERERAGPDAELLQCVESNLGLHDPAVQAKSPMWPRITWSGWKTPTGHRWNFGMVVPTPGQTPMGARHIPLNWNTEAVVYQMP